jgi:hypothetical protein
MEPSQIMDVAEIARAIRKIARTWELDRAKALTAKMHKNTMAAKEKMYLPESKYISSKISRNNKANPDRLKSLSGRPPALLNVACPTF